MSPVIYKCRSSFINVAHVLYFGTNGASYTHTHTHTRTRAHAHAHTHTHTHAHTHTHTHTPHMQSHTQLW